MVGFHGSDYGHGWEEFEEGAVELVGLDHQRFACAPMRSVGEVSRFAANHIGWVLVGNAQCVSDHGGGGCLAMCAGDRNSSLA